MTRFDGARRLADAALEATVVGSFSRIGFAARRALFDWDAEPVVDMSGRVALVTGATGGLGLAAATALAQRNADVWIVGRDPQRTEAARRAIAAVAPDSSVTTAVADLAVLDDVRNLADRVRRSVPRLDVLIHNAGALAHDLRYTADGLEVTAQVHVVAPFLLTTALLPILQTTPDARVITVSSGGMYTQRLDVDALATPAIPFNGVRAYANAKRAQVVLNELWSKHRGASGVVFHAMHPGWANTPGVRESLPRFRALMGPLLRTPSQGADTMVWLAADPRALETNGQFWLDRRPRSVAPLPGTRTSDADAERCWSWCVDRAGVIAPLEAAAMKIAIVGTGVSGLVAAHMLHPHHEITVFESDTRIGGHANTVDVEVDGRSVAVDTGFIVYNDRNYPGFRALLDRLGVATQPTEMSFSVSDPAHRPRVSRLEPQHDLRPAPQPCQSIVSACCSPTSRASTARPAGSSRVRRAGTDPTGSPTAAGSTPTPRSPWPSSYVEAGSRTSFVRQFLDPLRRVDLVGRSGDLHALSRARVRAFHGQPWAARPRRAARVAHRDRRFPTLRRGPHRPVLASHTSRHARAQDRHPRRRRRLATRRSCSRAAARNSSTV